MNSFHLILAMFEFVVLLFSLSLHEAAHAWMASRLGDPTARMMGRVTLNPIKHIDLIGTIIIPLFMLLMPGYGQFLIGWAKPTPVTPRNFKNITRDDILTTVAGPCSNLLAALAATVALLILSKTSGSGAAIIHEMAGMGAVDPGLMSSALFPLALLFYMGITLNVILFAFNLLPLPPLDGSHVVRHMLPYKALRVYDSLGFISLIVILFVGAPLIGVVVVPAMHTINSILYSF
jgi:Zn-dependent protease